MGIKTILFIHSGKNDYQADCLFHGLRGIYGDCVVDYIKYKCMYRGYPREAYGRGFTIYNLLEDIKVDRTDIVKKISSGFFDLVIYAGDMVYSDLPLPVWDTVRRAMPSTSVAIVDGNDVQELCPVSKQNFGILFKRENTGEGLPISFAVPREKFVNSITTTKPKKRLFALYEPYMPYIYINEKEYYQGYSDSWMGVTCKKAGWDCLRHYEIMSQGCIPFFLDVENMPVETCATLPKGLLLEIKDRMYPLYESRRKREAAAPPGFVEEIWAYMAKVYSHAAIHCTTQALAEGFISRIEKVQQGKALHA